MFEWKQNLSLLRTRLFQGGSNSFPLVLIRRLVHLPIDEQINQPLILGFEGRDGLLRLRSDPCMFCVPVLPDISNNGVKQGSKPLVRRKRVEQLVELVVQFVAGGGMVLTPAMTSLVR